MNASTLQEVARRRIGAWRAAGAGLQTQRWLREGVRLDWVNGPPRPFDHGTSLGDCTAAQLDWLEAEKQRCLETGAWVRQTRRRFVSRAFLVPKPGHNK